MSNDEKFIQEMYAASMERTIKRLWITTILLIVLLVGSNVGWLIYESQYIEVEQTIEATQQADNGTNTIVGGDYGNTESQDNN